MARDFEPIRVLGMMSGTSMDGVDAAIVETDGEGVINFGPTGFHAYPPDVQKLLHDARGKWPGDDLDAAHEAVIEAHRALASEFDCALIGFHGQTLAHDPAKGRTHQLGNGATLAARVGRDVVWDFRTADMAAGGEGAPLAPFFHFALAKSIGAGETCAFLNLGGVANVTWIDPTKASPEMAGALLAFDTGPANALLNDFMAARTGQAFDENGVVAAKGKVDTNIIAKLIAHPFFVRPAPKSLDRDDFASLLAEIAPLNTEDGAATLTSVTAQSVAAALPHMPEPPRHWYCCGGGRHNTTMMNMISEAIGAKVVPVEEVGFDGDMLEAQAFAWLAVRSLRGLPLSAPSTTGCKRPVSGGRISRAKDVIDLS